MPSDLVTQFLSSMVMDYDKWHDGVGYDLDLIDQMDEAEKAAIEEKLIRAGVSDWRDLEALERLNTNNALATLLAARNSPDEQIRLYALRYGPKPADYEREEVILAGLNSASSRSKAMDEAAKHPSPRIITALLRFARDGEGSDAYKAAATLYYIHGKIDSPHSWKHRKFFLRFVDQAEDRKVVYEELCKKVRVDPSIIYE